MIAIDKKMLFAMLSNAKNNLEKEYKYINELNVFPVPDGDTGSNMMTTLGEALNTTFIDDNNLYESTKNFTRELLMNAHGNSGVILSQIFKGFFSPINENDKSMTINLLKMAFAKAKETSYKVVAKPKEGTILTVIKDVAEHVNSHDYKKVEELFKDVVEVADASVQKTPELLPVLKKAKVVDSGGYGLLKIFQGMNDALSSDIETIEKTENNLLNQPEIIFSKSGINSDFITEDENDLGYCCEFIIELGASIEDLKELEKQPFDPKKVSEELEKLGTSMVFVYDDTFLKVHLHSLTPYKVLEVAQKYGEFHKIKVDNMTLQRNKNKGVNTLIPTKQKEEEYSNDTVVIATVPNANIGKFLKDEFNVQHVINRSNNQNPSVKDFTKLINAPHSKNVILVIDNSDSYMSAQEAQSLAAKSNTNPVNVYLINAGDALTTFLSILNFNKFIEPTSALKQMQKALKKAFVVKLTRAIKDTIVGKMKIKKNDYILINEKKILNHNTDLLKLALSGIDLVLKKKKNSWNDSIYMIVGDKVADDTIETIKQYVRNMGYQIEIIQGGSSVYDLYIGA